MFVGQYLWEVSAALRISASGWHYAKCARPFVLRMSRSTGGGLGIKMKTPRQVPSAG